MTSMTPTDPKAALTPPAPTGNKKRELREAKAPDKSGWWWGTGRRKTAVARVRMKPGTGVVKVQVGAKRFKTIEEYFSEIRDRTDAVSPMKVTNTMGKFDVIARCNGGGFMGQAQSIRLGLARALRDYDPNFEGVLRDNGFLTRDPREVERKKYGQAGARRRFQFSKR
ncbi:MAG TPA: 30S ribosomal protein S9 [Phycisphaerales bacterium]|nr:30S ribosomal protein S9 [Phycisphaerales bacterium]